jgi:2-polyprenyl-6-methoxyphenol hydroxylase-like FAD-dependent oxidoreductase
MPANPRNVWPVAIAGGGIGGLACALALARHGFQSLVLEQAAEFGEAGVGLQMAPNALTVLDVLGVGESAKRHALLIERLLMMDAVTGTEVANIPLGERFQERFGNPYAVAHRADIHDALLDACRASPLIELRNGCRVVEFAASGKGVAVTIANGERIEAAALVGADGVHSNIRRRIIGDGDPPPACAVIYRATIAAADMPKDLQQPYPTFWAGPGWHVIYYPMRDWSTFNLGCTVVTNQTPPNDGEEVSPLRHAAARAAHPEAIQALPHPPPRAGGELDARHGDAARRRRASDGAVHRAGRGDGTGRRDLPRQQRGGKRWRFRQGIPALSGHPHGPRRAGADLLADDGPH